MYTDKVMSKIESKKTLPSRADIDDMLVQMFKLHSDAKEGHIDLEIIQIVALKMFLRYVAKVDGAFTKAPYCLKQDAVWKGFGQYIAEEINEKIDRINHFQKLSNIIRDSESVN